MKRGATAPKLRPCPQNMTWNTDDLKASAYVQIEVFCGLQNKPKCVSSRGYIPDPTHLPHPPHSIIFHSAAFSTRHSTPLFYGVLPPNHCPQILSEVGCGEEEPLPKPHLTQRLNFVGALHPNHCLWTKAVTLSRSSWHRLRIYLMQHCAARSTAVDGTWPPFLCLDTESRSGTTTEWYSQVNNDHK